MKPSVTLVGEIKIPLINFLIFAALTPLIFYIGSRYPVQRNNWLARTPLYLLGAVAFTVVHGVARMLVYPINDPATGKACPIGFALLRSVFLYNVADDVFYVYLPILLSVHMLWYYQRLQDRELRAAHLQTELEGPFASSEEPIAATFLVQHHAFDLVVDADRRWRSRSDDDPTKRPPSHEFGKQEHSANHAQPRTGVRKPLP